MEKTRYFLALLTVVTLPPAFLFWFVLHPFIHFWRRLGTGATYLVVVGAMVLVGWGVAELRGPLLAVDFGFQPVLAGVAALSYLGAVAIELRCRRHLKLRILVGLPEVVSDDPGGRLLTEGIYSRLRHPRYVSVILGLLAAACFTNYLAVWSLFLLTFPIVHLLVWVEEKELKERFGEAYLEYADRVPRFLPRSKG